MKVTLRMHEGRLSVYVTKKDLEAFVTETEHPTIWGGWVKLDNGWTLIMPDMPADTKLPITVDARKTEG